MDTEKMIEGKETKTGKKTYLFYNKKGNIVEVLPETAKEKGYKPVSKGNHNDSDMEELTLDEKKKKVAELNNEKKENPNSVDELDELREKQLRKLNNKKSSNNQNKEKQNNIQENEITQTDIEDKVENEITEKNLNENEKEKYRELKRKKKEIQQERQELQQYFEKQDDQNTEEKDNIDDLKKKQLEQIEKSKKSNFKGKQNDNSDIQKNEDDQKIENKKQEKKEIDKKKQENKISLIKDYLNNQENPIKNFIKNNNSFEIFYSGNLIYSSKNTNKDRIKLYDDHFELFGVKYPYSGLRIKKINNF